MELENRSASSQEISLKVDKKSTRLKVENVFFHFPFPSKVEVESGKLKVEKTAPELKVESGNGSFHG